MSTFEAILGAVVAFLVLTIGAVIFILAVEWVIFVGSWAIDITEKICDKIRRWNDRRMLNK